MVVQLGYARIGGVLKPLKPQNLHLPFAFWIDPHLMYQLFHPIPCSLRTTTFRSQQTTTELCHLTCIFLRVGKQFITFSHFANKPKVPTADS